MTDNERLIEDTPTNDEREVARVFAEAVGWRWDGLEPFWQEQFIEAARKTAGFRRTEVPEPSAEPKHDESCAEWCNHCTVCGEGIRYGSRCREHYQNQPQGEPSDAIVKVVAQAIVEANEEYGEFVGSGSASWEAFIARAALRAAGGAR